jgi:glutaconyl-CoA/methylmalonyl-CoA decarboxylase subunit gamma
MKKYTFTIRGNKYDVRIKSFEDSRAVIEVNGSVFEAQIHQEIKTTKTPKLVRAQPPVTPIKSLAPATGLNKVPAPLPGTVMKIKIKEGDSVTIGDTLLILEAMKMENNILAERNGVVKNIRIKEGEAVMQGDVMLEIE